MTTTPVRTPATTRVLFVCLGNICRSPLAEAVFVHQAMQRGLADRFHADSCGTGPWHVGNEPDERAQATARRFGVPMRHIGRQLDPNRDFERFDVLIAMDRQNLAEILRRGGPRERSHLLRAFEEGGQGPLANPGDVPDPYSGSMRDFEEVFHLVHRACGGLLDHLAGSRGTWPSTVGVP